MGVAFVKRLTPRTRVAFVKRRSSISVFSIVDSPTFSGKRSDNILARAINLAKRKPPKPPIDKQKPAFRQFIADREFPSKRRTGIKIASWPKAAFPKEKPLPLHVVPDCNIPGRRIWTSLTEFLESL